ncbi:MAG: tetratricopeptide repeat protein, partial [Deltaproteobacteria bacterium]
MRIDCERCGAAYRIPDAAVGAAGIRAECPRCGHQQVVGAQAPAAAVGASTAPSGGSTGGVDPLDLFDPAAPPREDLFDLSAPVNRPQDTGATVTVQDDDDPFAALPDEEVRGGGAVPPPSPAPPAGAPGGAREELPGAVGGGPRPRPTPTPRPAASPPKAPEYRIKKPDGRILGPVDFAELERMAQSGDLAPGDQVARNDDEFRLMSQYGEVAPLLAQAARNYQVRTAVVAAGPRRSKLGLVLGALVLLGAGGAVALYVFAPGLLPREVRAPVDALFAPEPQAIPNPVEADVPLFQMQALGAEEEAGPAGEGARVAARRALDEDTAEGYRRAVQLLKRRLVEAPDDTRAIGLLILATGYASRWKPRPQVVQRLLRYADYLKEVQDPSPEALLGRAAARYLLGPAAAPEARQLARQALAAAPDDIQVKLMLARALARIDHEAAVARLKALRKVAADAPRVWLDLGEACLAAGDFACAERAFSERLKATPGHAEAAEALASLYVKLGRFDAARTMYERILQDDPMRADADLMVAVVDYQGQGRLEAAERRLEALLDKADLVEARTVHLARTHLAAVYRLLGRAEAAKAQIER